MSRILVSTGRKNAPCPPNQLGQPRKAFAETFSAVTAIKEHFGIKG